MLLVFALATGLPVILFAWLLAFSVNKVGTIYNGIKNFEKWFRKIVALLFVLTGLYYIVLIYF
jgi:cytochrome c-type biogenesis protein